MYLVRTCILIVPNICGATILIQNSYYKISSFLQPFHMMAQSTLFIVLVAALLINTLSYCSAENVYCVTPTATSCSSCPHNSINCTTLSEYAQEAELYFTSNTTMVFLPGDHVLDRTITVANVTRLTMRGESSSGNIATVVRNGSVGFSFTNMVNFNIYSLAFTSYNRSWSYGSHPASNSALFLQSTQNAQLVNCSFHGNLGTALAVNNTSVTLAESSKFIHNQCACQSFSERCELGCGITALNSTLAFTESTTFLKNKHNNVGVSKVGAGAILAISSSLHFTGTSNFFDNVKSTNKKHEHAHGGGATYVTNNSVLNFHGTNNFINNSANNEGGAIYTSHNTLLTFTGTSNFINNYVHRGSVRTGGAIYIHGNAVLTFNGTSNFINNSAVYYGGAICTHGNAVLTFNGTNNFINNSAGTGGAVYAGINTLLTFIGTSVFSNNSANWTSGAIYLEINAVLTLNGTNNFINNSANYLGGVIFAVVNTSLVFTGNSSFNSNSAVQGGAILAEHDSTLTFDGNVSFTNNGHNTGDSRGGALYLDIGSTSLILPHTIVYWKNNHANLGGAIFVSDVSTLIYCTQYVPYISRVECFFKFPCQNPFSSLDIQLIFKNNSANTAGSVLYGGAIDNCKLAGQDPYRSDDTFFHIEDVTNCTVTSKISSDPLRICPCANNFPHCSVTSVSYSVYPGETFQVSVVAVGQRDGTVPSTVRGTVRNWIDSSPVNLLDYQYLQKTNNTCTKLNYTVFSLSQKVEIELYPEDSPCSKSFDRKMKISVNLNQTCPPGFNTSDTARSCVCEPRLAQYTNQCNITNGLGEITREQNKHFWFGYDRSSHELILHPYCPFDYCVSDTKVFPLNSTDVQCAHNRSGLLCGRCRDGYSLVLGTSQCRKCTNIYFLLLIPFAVMGVALVFLLLICKLTVAKGTLSGLLFYANIVGVNRTTFLSVESTDALPVFIAWLNLDFGIETCFYDGIDAYSKTWLQFVFPVYLWLLVGLMILVSHFSQRFANLLGNNPVSVLATLILLSYAKILRTLIATVYFTHLEYPTYSKSVWLHDANIDYLSGKHIPLFLVAMSVFLFLFLPYTLLLLFGQWLQAISHLRLFSWVNSARLKPFMDAYHAPYKAKHRYWPGLLLVLRFVLLLVFVVNPQQDPSINLLAILLGSGMLHLWSGGVYKNWCLDALEGSFMLNLTMLCAVTYHVKLSGGDQLAVGYTSVSIALATFIGILAYHIFQQLRQTKLWKKVPKVNLKFKKLNTKQKVDNHINDQSVEMNQLREPWLEDLLQPTHSSL